MRVDLAQHDIDAPCPGCSYPVWVLIAEVSAQITVTCPCCRARIRLLDPDGSMQSASARLNKAIDELSKTLKRTST